MSTQGQGSNGIPRTYEDIWKAFSGKHGDTPDTRRIHSKWKRIAAEVSKT